MISVAALVEPLPLPLLSAPEPHTIPWNYGATLKLAGSESSFYTLLIISQIFLE